MVWVYKHVSGIKIEFSQKRYYVEELHSGNLYVRLQSAGSLVQVELQVCHIWWQRWDTILCKANRVYCALQSYWHCMTTQSGRAYKTMVETMEEWKKMMADLVDVDH